MKLNSEQHRKLAADLRERPALASNPEDKEASLAKRRLFENLAKLGERRAQEAAQRRSRRADRCRSGGRHSCRYRCRSQRSLRWTWLLLLSPAWVAPGLRLILSPGEMGTPPIHPIRRINEQPKLEHAIVCKDKNRTGNPRSSALCCQRSNAGTGRRRLVDRRALALTGLRIYPKANSGRSNPTSKPSIFLFVCNWKPQ